MGQRDRRYGRMADDRSGRYENRSSYGGSYGSSEEGWGDRGSHERSSFEQGRSNRESSTGSGYGRRGRGGTCSAPRGRVVGLGVRGAGARTVSCARSAPWVATIARIAKRRLGMDAQSKRRAGEADFSADSS